MPNNLRRGDAAFRDFGQATVTKEGDVMKLVDEIEETVRATAKTRANIEEQFNNFSPQLQKRWKDLLNQQDDILTDAKQAVYDSMDDALHNKNNDGSFTERDIENIAERTALYQEALKQYWVKINEKKQPESGASEEESLIQGIESELSVGETRLDYCENTYREIVESGLEIAFDEDMSGRLNQYAKSMQYMRGTLDALKKMKDEIKTRLGTDKQVPAEEIRLINEKLDRLSINLKYLENHGTFIGKKIEEKSKDQLDLIDRLTKLSVDLQSVKNKGVAGKQAREVSEIVLKKIDALRESATKGSKINASEVAGLEDLAKNQVIAPEEEADVYAERMEIFYKLAPKLKKDETDIDAMSAQMMWASKKEKTAPPKMKELFEKTGKKLSEAMGLNDVLNQAAKMETRSSLEEIKDQVKEYNEVLPEAKKLFDKLEPELKLMKVNDLQPKFLWADSDMARKQMNMDQRAMFEGWKSIVKKGNVTLEELDVIADSFEEKIYAPVNELLKKDSAAARDRLVREQKERELEEKFMKKGELQPSEQEAEEETAAEPVVRPAVKDRVKTEKEFFGGEEFGDVVSEKAEKAVLKKSVEQMLAESGVVDIEPQVIIDLLSKQEMDMLAFNVRKDILEKSDANHEAFYQILRAAFNEHIFKDLKKEDRDRLLKSATEQTYGIMRSAIESEIDRLTLQALSNEASKLAKVGKIGASIASNVAIAATVGLGAAAVVGSGGAAAAIAGISVPIVREVKKRLFKSEVFKATKEKAGSLWDRTVGKMFKKEKPPVDEEAIRRLACEKLATKEHLAEILSNQIRENSSQNIIQQVNFFAEQKNEAMRKPSAETLANFEKSFDGVSKEIFNKQINYISAQMDFQDLPDEEKARLARCMTLTIGLNQRGEVASALAFSELDKKNKPEDRGWFIDAAEKFFKVRSEGIGASLIGGATAYSIAETTSLGRIISGAIGGAGLGLMIEKKTRMGEKEKIVQIIDGLIKETEKKIKNKKAGELTEQEMFKAYKDSSYVTAQLDAGVFDDNRVLKARAENFVFKINKMILENMADSMQFMQHGSEELEKQTKKNINRIAKFAKDNKTIIYMAGGAVLGGALGYLGGQLSQYLHGAKGEAPVEPQARGAVKAEAPQVGVAEKAIPPQTPLRAVPPETPLRAVPPETPLRAVAPETPLRAIPPETPLKAISPEEAELPSVYERVTAEATATPKAPAGIKYDAIVKRAAESAVEQGGNLPPVGQPLEVHALYTSSIEKLDAAIKDINQAEPVYLTRLEKIELDKLTRENAGGSAIFDFILRAHERGQVFEDAAGNQYHADQLDLSGTGEMPPAEAGVVETTPAETPVVKKGIVNPYDEPAKAEANEPKIKNPYDEPAVEKGKVKIEEPKVEKQKIVNPYEDKFGEEVDKIRIHPATKADKDFVREFDRLMNKPTKISDERYDRMIELYNEKGAEDAAEYARLLNQGKGAQADRYFEQATQPVETETEPVEKPMKEETAPVKEEKPAKIEEPTIEEKRAQIIKEIEDKRQAEQAADTESEGRVKEIVAERERALVGELKSPKAKSAYEWLTKQLENDDLSAADKKAVQDLKDDFVKDMIDDKKVEPSLLGKITRLQKRIG